MCRWAHAAAIWPMSGKLVFEAYPADGSDPHIVKFVRKYGTEVHQALAGGFGSDMPDHTFTAACEMGTGATSFSVLQL